MSVRHFFIKHMSRTVIARSWVHKDYGTIVQMNFRKKTQEAKNEDGGENTMQTTGQGM